MGRSLLRAVVLLALLAVGVAAVACGEEDELEVVEGEPVELGELSYNVQITRFLNRADAEDEAYLEGQPEAPPGQAYLGVFMRITNEGEEPQATAVDFTIVDTRENSFRPASSPSPFALEPGAEVPAGSELPTPDSPAASGPIQGAMVLFLVDEGVTENRPLELEIPGPGDEVGRVELDI